MHRALHKALKHPMLPFRRHFVLFMTMSVLAIAQLSWWIVFQLSEGHRVSQIQHGIWTQQITLAEQHRRLSGEVEFSPWLELNFPELEIAKSGELRVKDASRAALDRVAGRRVRMFIGEGVFFGLLLLGGVLYMYRTLQEEISNEHKHSVFLSATSHELKTPITSLRLYLDTLIDRELPAAQRMEMLAIMRADLSRLNDLIERLLQAQKALSRDKSERYGTVDLSEETEQVIKDYLPRIDASKYAISFDIDFGLNARADAERWQLVVRNLIENALKYSPHGGAIDLFLTRDNRWVQFSVTDHGQGFDPKEADLIFGRFYRIGSEETRRTQGVGLGLYLVKEIVESFGGTVRAQSEGPGKGARFIVQIPFVENTSNA